MNVRSWIAWLKRTISRLWNGAAAPIQPVVEAVELEEVAPVIAELPPPSPEKKARRKVGRREEDKTQAHYYLGDLLETLDDYFADLEYLRRGDPEGAANFEKFGCAICDESRLLSKDMEPFFFEKMPAQGCFYYGRHDHERSPGQEQRHSIRFAYFQKMHQPVNVQATNGVIYTIGGVWGVKHRHLFQAHVAVFPDQTIKVLKEIAPRYHTVGKGSRRNGGERPHSIVRMEWGYSSWVQDMVNDHNRHFNKNKSVDEYFSRFFSLMVNSVLGSELDMNVRVKKGGRVATFSINMLRTPYFFADREKTVNENGNTHRILHIVKPHERTTRSGNKKIIKAHWRGLRRFTWNGYDVSIGMPGAHYKPLMDFTAEGWSEADMLRETGAKGLDKKDAAAMIDRAVTAQVRGEAA